MFVKVNTYLRIFVKYFYIFFEHYFLLFLYVRKGIELRILFLGTILVNRAYIYIIIFPIVFVYHTTAYIIQLANARRKLIQKHL